MFGILNSVLDVAKNVSTVVVAPVAIAVELTSAATKPIAEAVESVVNDVKSLKD